MFSRFILDAIYISTLLLYIAEFDSVTWILYFCLFALFCFGTGSHNAGQADLKLVILMPPPSESRITGMYHHNWLLDMAHFIHPSAYGYLVVFNLPTMTNATMNKTLAQVVCGLIFIYLGYT
jgi:hypothetical protein